MRWCKRFCDCEWRREIVTNDFECQETFTHRRHDAESVVYFEDLFDDVFHMNVPRYYLYCPLLENRSLVLKREERVRCQVCDEPESEIINVSLSHLEFFVPQTIFHVTNVIFVSTQSRVSQV